MTQPGEGPVDSTNLEERGKVPQPDVFVAQGHPGIAKDLETLDEIDPKGSMSARLRIQVEEKLRNV